MSFFRALFIMLALTIISVGPVNAQAKPGDRQIAPADADGPIIAGKLFCSLKRIVVAPFHSVITSVDVQVGQKVRPGEVLAGFRLEPEVVQDLLRKTAGNHLMEMKVKDAELTQRLVELARKRKEVKTLTGENLASPESLRQLNSQVGLLADQRKALRDRLAAEKDLFRDDLKFLSQRLGAAVIQGSLPEQGFLTAPIDGRIVWINAQLRVGAELGPDTKAVVVGVMNPMILVAQAHETEAVGLKPGQKGFLVIEPYPDRRFPVTVNRISWSPDNIQVDQPSYYQVEFTVPNPDLLLKEGFSGNVYIER